MPSHRSGSCPGGISCASHHTREVAGVRNTREDGARARERERERERVNSQREFSELLLDDVVGRVPRYPEQFVIVLGTCRGCPQQTVARGEEHQQEEEHSRQLRRPSGTHPEQRSASLTKDDDDLGATFGRLDVRCPSSPASSPASGLGHDPPALCHLTGRLPPRDQRFIA